jgi:hypothetical protein
MPTSVNGFGTGLISASKKRNNGGAVQFDAIEAFMLAYLPIIPYKAIHVLSMQHGGFSERYQFAPLRLSGRLILRAFLKRWGTLLMCFGAVFLGIFGAATMTMARPFTATDRSCLIAFALMLVAGILGTLAWYAVSRTDERIKDVLGPHRYGTSDPLYWSEETVSFSGSVFTGVGGGLGSCAGSRRASAL